MVVKADPRLEQVGECAPVTFGVPAGKRCRAVEGPQVDAVARQAVHDHVPLPRTDRLEAALGHDHALDRREHLSDQLPVPLRVHGVVVLDEDRHPANPLLHKPLPHPLGWPLDRELPSEARLDIDQRECGLRGVVDAAQVDPASLEKPQAARLWQEVEANVADKLPRKPPHQRGDPGQRPAGGHFPARVDVEGAID